MKHINEHSGDVLIARIVKSKKIIESIISFCESNNIKSAWITGIGAVSSVDLLFYNLEKKIFIEKKISKSLEICSLSGNIGLFNDKLTSHIHAVFSDNNMNTVGGHLKEAVVGATCEIKIEIFDQPITRKFDKEIGLNLIQTS